MTAKVVTGTDGETSQEFVRANVKPGAEVYTDAAAAYDGLLDYAHGSVKHSVGEYVNGCIHTNGVESF